MAVLVPGKLLYLPTSHTASEAVVSALKKLDGAFVPYDKRKGVGYYATLDEIKPLCESRLTGTETVFTTIRNPYDLLAAWWRDNHDHFQMRRLEEVLDRPPTFQEFLEMWVHIDAEPKLDGRPYMKDGRIFYQVADCDQVLRYENLQNEFNALIRKIPELPGALSLDLPAPAPSKDHWSFSYDKDVYTYVNRQFQKEFVQFGYPFLWKN